MVPIVFRTNIDTDDIALFELALPGIPCTSSSFTEAHMLPGNPLYPLKDGVAPYF